MDDQTDLGSIAIVGCGYWGMNYVRVLSELMEAPQIAVYDASASRREAAGAQFPGVRVISSPEVLLSDEAIVAAVVATPATTHAETAELLLRAGKHVLVEKPLTVNPADALRLVELADGLGLTLSVGHTFLFNDSVRFLKDRVDSGASGPIRYLYARRTNLGPVRNDVNAFWDLAPHDVSIFNHLVDSEPAWVSAVGACLLGNDRHDVGFASITYKDGTVAHLHVSWLDPFKVRELVVVGWDERIVFDDLSPTESIRIFEKGVMVGVNPDVGSGLVVSDGGIHSPSIPKGEPLKNQVGAFLRDIVSGDRPFSDGLTGLRVVEVMDAMNRSAALHGSPTSVTVSEPSKRASLP